MKKISNLVLGLMLCAIFCACSSDGDVAVSGGTGIESEVTITGIGYQYKQSDITRSGMPATNQTLATAMTPLNDDLMLVAEMVNAEDNRKTRVDPSYTSVSIDKLYIFTYYNDGRPIKTQTVDISSDKTFKFLLPDNGCTAVFVGVPAGASITPTLSNGDIKIPSLAAGKDIYYKQIEFMNVPTSVDLSDMTPLLSRVDGLSVSKATGPIRSAATNDANWPITSISNVSFLEGVQSESGEITINKTTATYANKGKADEVDQSTDLYTEYDLRGGSSTGIGKIFVSSGSDITLNLDITLEGGWSKTGVKLPFDTPMQDAYNYTIKVYVVKSKLSVHYMNGITGEEFTSMWQEKAYKYNDLITRPTTAPAADSYLSQFFSLTRWTTDANLSLDKQFVFEDDTKFANPDNKATHQDIEWVTAYVNKDAQGNITETNKSRINATTFPTALADGSDVYLYAFYEPNLHRWNIDKTVQAGGVDNGVGGVNDGNIVTASDTYKQLPKAATYVQYANAAHFYDTGYGELKIPGVWFKKWDTGNTSGNRAGAKDAATTGNPGANGYTVAHTGKVTNGDFSSTGYSKEDFFFMPLMGYYPGNTRGSYYDSSIGQNSWPKYASTPTEIGKFCGVWGGDDAQWRDGTLQVHVTTALQYSTTGVTVLSEHNAYNAYFNIWPDETRPATTSYDLNNSVTIGSQKDGGTQEY